MARKTTSSEQGYRRGSVLGLTVAEVSLLFVFVILLVLAGPAKRGHEVGRALQEVGSPEDDSLTPAEVLRKLVIPDSVRQDTWRMLVPATEVGTAAELVERLRGMVESRGGVNEAMRRDLIAARGTADSLRRVLTSTLGREDSLRVALNVARGGSDMPSCLHGGDGARVFLFDVVLLDEGYRLELTETAEEHLSPSGLDASELVGRVLGEPAFIDGARPFYDWSVSNQCRFFANVYDEVSASKDIYKQRMDVLERRFYKREMTGRFPHSSDFR